MLAGGDDFTDRATDPNRWDQFFGVALMLLVLEAARRTSGLIMPAVVIGFVAYAMTGPLLPAPWTHRGYDIGRLTGHMTMTLEGIFGTAVDVSSSLIIPWADLTGIALVVCVLGLQKLVPMRTVAS